MRLFLSSFVSAALFSTVAMAQAVPAKPATAAPAAAAARAMPVFDKATIARNISEGMIKMNDTNQDGAISKEEWQKKKDGEFAEKDTNKDGKLTKEELIAGFEASIRPPSSPVTANPSSTAAPK